MKFLNIFWIDNHNFDVITLIFIGVFTHFFVGMILNAYNKLLYGKGTFMAFVPFFNLYLLGRLLVNKVIGYVLVLFMILFMIVRHNLDLMYLGIILLLCMLLFYDLCKTFLHRYKLEHKEECEEEIKNEIGYVGHQKPNIAIDNFQNSNDHHLIGSRFRRK